MNIKQRSFSHPCRSATRLCVEPTLVLQSAWERNAETKKYSFDLGDNMLFLLDLRFADDTLLFARTAAEAMALLDDIVRKFQNIGLQLNAAKSAVLTSEVQRPSSLHTNNGVELRVLKQHEAHRYGLVA